MSDNKLKAYPVDFKESSVKLAIESNRSIAQIARELGINASTLYTWINKYSKPKEPAMRTNEHIYDKNKRLKKELARLTQERDLLKKAAAYFAKETQ